jgi:hypothetical protein
MTKVACFCEEIKKLSSVKVMGKKVSVAHKICMIEKWCQVICFALEITGTQATNPKICHRF